MATTAPTATSRTKAIRELRDLILATSHVDGPALADMTQQIDEGAEPTDYTGDGVHVYTFLLACSILLDESADSIMQSTYRQLGW